MLSCACAITISGEVIALGDLPHVVLSHPNPKPPLGPQPPCSTVSVKWGASTTCVWSLRATVPASVLRHGL